MPKKIIFQDAARAALLRGAEKLSDSVRFTLGPSSKSVVLGKRYGSPLIIDDGVTIAREIHLEDGFENLGAQIVKEASSKTNDEAGDGTTTSTILAVAMLREAAKHIAVGRNPMLIKEGMHRAAKEVIDHLIKTARPVDTLEKITQVAYIAGGDTIIGQMIADAIAAVGKNGVIIVEDNPASNISMEIMEGVQYERGWLSRHFVTDPVKRECIMREPAILLYDGRIQNFNKIMPLINWSVKEQTPLLILADDIDKTTMTVLVVNKLRGSLKCCAIRSPGYGDRQKEFLEDIAVLTGGRVVSEESGYSLDTVKVEDLGRVKKAVISKSSTIFMKGYGTPEELQERIGMLNLQIKDTEDQYQKEKLGERISKLSGTVAIIKVGAQTEIESKKLKAKVEDAVHATRAAMEEGIISGGGSAFIQATKIIEYWELSDSDMEIGAKIVMEALSAPIKQIAQNAGQNPDVIANSTRYSKDGYGFNAANGKLEYLFDAGVVDPVKVARIALTNAVSIAATIITTEAIVLEGESNGTNSKRNGS